jgi:hypothetical protein
MAALAYSAHAASSHSFSAVPARRLFSLDLIVVPPFAGWHPGPHGHELRAHILAWNYLRVLQDAIA